MKPITRRQSLGAGAGLLAAAALPVRAGAAIPVADVKPPSYPIEKGATLHVLRPTKFVDPDETIFRANSKRFTDATGVPVRVDFVNWPDMPTQTAIAANTGAGPDIIIAFGPDPHLFLGKIVELLIWPSIWGRAMAAGTGWPRSTARNGTAMTGSGCRWAVRPGRRCIGPHG